MCGTFTWFLFLLILDSKLWQHPRNKQENKEVVKRNEEGTWRFHYQWWATWKQIVKKKALKVEKSEDAAAVIWDFREIIKSKKRNIILY